MVKMIPRMPGLPVLGNLLDLRRDRLAFLCRVQQTCGDIGQYRALSRTLILIAAPAYARGVLVEHADSVDQTHLFRSLLHPLLGHGLLTSPRALHRQQRRLIAPTFQPRQIAAYADTIVRYSQEIEQNWKDGASIDLAQEMMRLTLSVIGRVLFDADLLTEARTGSRDYHGD